MTSVAAAVRAWFSDWRLFIPKSVTVLRQEGYHAAAFRADLLAGLTVAIVALPLAMAIAIASGTTPDKGLITAIVAGFLISALGGSRFQIGGPTGAFIVVVYGVIAAHGFDGLVIATLMAGIILIVAGVAKLGTWIKYIPEPVVTGFTAGIAVIIFSSQIRDFLGLAMAAPPADFIAKMDAFWAARETLSAPTLLVAFGALAVILGLRKFAPRWPGFLIAVAAAAAVTALFQLPLETVGSRFGGVSATLPAPHVPEITWARVRDLFQPALTIAFLAGVESLLSAMVADGMTGRRHRSNCELVAQGIANIASAVFGGISATGAIARTATNIRAGARTPIAGMAHAAFLLAFMLALGPLLSFLPLASLAAVLVIVAWNMSEQERFRHLLRGPAGDRVVLIATFLLTVLVDLTVAIEVGVVLAAIIFMHRMAEATAIEKGAPLIERDQDDFAGAERPRYDARAELPDGVERFVLRGPLFFGAASRIGMAFEAAFPPPKVFIVDLSDVPMADATGAAALARFIDQCAAHKTMVILAGLVPRVRTTFAALHLLDKANLMVSASTPDAVVVARHVLSGAASDPANAAGS